MISGTRTVLVEHDMLQLMVRPDPGAPVAAHLQLGVVARLGDCDTEWCELRTGGFKGWAPKARVWGVTAQEIRD
jgi:SH3-like domain-containing protein